MTGYPSIDKPWLKYYREEAINSQLPECTIYEYLWECNKDHLNDIALYYFGNKIAFRKMFKRIQETANAFSEIGVKKGDIVTLLITNTPEAIYVIYGLNLIGAISNIEYVTMNAKDICSDIIETASKTVVILDILIPKFLECLNGKTVISISAFSSMPSIAKLPLIFKSKNKRQDNYILFDDLIKNQKTSVVRRNEYEPTATAVMVHSGGTTGKPKAVELTNDNLNAIAFQYMHFGSDFKRQETFMHCIPPFHAFGLSVGIHMPLCLGLTVNACAKYDEEYVKTVFYKVKPTHFFCGVSHITAILNSKQKNKDFSWLKSFAAGGASFSTEKEEEANKYLINHKSKTKILMGYGMSELSATVCAERNDAYKQGAAGIPLPKCNVKVSCVDTGTELPYMEIGELSFCTPSSMKGYYNNLEETNSVVEYDKRGNKWIHTGDLGYVDPDGFVFITGRLKRIYTTVSEKGALFKIYPDYIEKTIEAMDGIKECAVVCVPDTKKKNVAYAFVSFDNKAVDGDNIIFKCAETLPAYSIPKCITILDEIPKTPIGKKDYVSLERTFDNI